MGELTAQLAAEGCEGGTSKLQLRWEPRPGNVRACENESEPMLFRGRHISTGQAGASAAFCCGRTGGGGEMEKAPQALRMRGIILRE